MGDPPRLDPDAPLQVSPPADPVGEGVAMARVRGALFGSSRPAQLERYSLLEKLGEGTSGAVYSAWDPRLDRKVAIKVLHAGATAELEREARTLAKLAHPNVVTIHDVGESDDQLFLAMEFIDGAPLSALEADALGWRRVVSIYRQALAGLAAAHDLGIVHRDFKPANAILGSDGRVRVVDFGLARTSVEPTVRLTSAVHTRAAGTPRYMAPEQHRGEAISASSDQYSACAALWEALLNRPAFDAGTLKALAEAKSVAPELPASSRVPSRVLRVLRRGLSPSACDRFPSLRDLDASLARSARGPGRPTLTIVGLGALVAGGLTLARPNKPCVGADAPPQSWSTSSRKAMGDAFNQTGLPHAETSFETTDGILDRWTQSWGDSRANACELHAQGMQSAEGLDLRTQCLEEQRTRFDALLSVFATADDTVVDRAVDAASRLPSPKACADLERLRTVHPIADEAKEQVSAAGESVARAEAELLAGHFARAQELLVPVRRACAAGELPHQPTCVNANLAAGKAASDAGEHSDAARILSSAAVEAQRARMLEGFATAAALLSWEYGEVDGRLDDAMTWAQLGKASIDGEEAPAAELKLLNAEAAALTNANRWEEALTAHQLRLTRLEALYGPDSPLAVTSYANIANLENLRGRDEDAEAAYDKALELGATVFGASHPKILTTRQNRAGMLVRGGRVAEGVDELVGVLDLQREALGPTHPALVPTLTNISIARSRLDDPAGALASAREATALVVKAHGADSPVLVETWMVEVLPLLDLGRHEEAVKLSRRALEASQKQLGPDHLTTAYARRCLGGALRMFGEEEEGQSNLVAATALFEKLGMLDQAKQTEALRTAEDDSE